LAGFLVLPILADFGLRGDEIGQMPVEMLSRHIHEGFEVVFVEKKYEKDSNFEFRKFFCSRANVVDVEVA
jgi:hypothetical protein